MTTDYLHLILWDEEDLEIVGATACADGHPAGQSAAWRGSYSYSLFHYDGRMDDVLQQRH